MRALISVWDKTDVDAFARGLADLGFELVSSGGTASFLEEHGLDVTRVEEVTSAPEMLGGRVKTLHPRIHAGILARLDLDDDRATLAEHEIEPFDLVCVNLYPFTSVAGRRGVERGGHRRDDRRRRPVDAAGGGEELRPCRGGVPPGAVRAGARRAAETARSRSRRAAPWRPRRSPQTAAYDAAIARWFAEPTFFPDQLTLTFEKIADLAYGENPHQTAAYYAEAGARRHLLSQSNQLGGKELSYNNLADLEGRAPDRASSRCPAAVIVKHANPCGVAVAATIEEAYERALAADPVSAFGCVLVLNRPVTGPLGRRIAEHFVEVLHAPELDDEALEALQAKPALRILRDRERRAETPGERDYKRVLGGLLVQDRDTDVDDRDGMQVVTGTVDEEQWGDLLFAWRVCKHVSSNAIVLAKGLQTIGIGAGQMSRVDAVRIAIEKARELGHDPAGSVLASDAFFPFADGPQLALDAGVAALIQPGGSKRDDEVIAAVTAAGAAMVFTGRRHFRH